MFEAVFGRSTATGDAEPIAGPVTGAVPAGERVDLGRVLTGLRHLPAGEPARVFTELAGICVPALCDECWIEIIEQGGHRSGSGGPARGSPRTGRRPTAPRQRRPVPWWVRPRGRGTVLR